MTSTCIKDLILRPETTKLLEENIGTVSLDISLGDDFFGFDAKSKFNKNKNKQVRLHPNESFFTAKETMKKNENAT